MALWCGENTSVPLPHHIYRIYNFSALGEGVQVAVVLTGGGFWAIVDNF